MLTALKIKGGKSKFSCIRRLFHHLYAIEKRSLLEKDRRQIAIRRVSTKLGVSLKVTGG
jgi:hypothetical protein